MESERQISLRELVEERDRLERELEQVKEAIRVVERLSSRNGPSPRGSSESTLGTRPDPGKFKRLSQRQIAALMLTEVGDFLHVEEIAKRAINQGFYYPRGIKALKASLSATMTNHRDEFVRHPTRPATFGLSDWTKSKPGSETGE